MNGNQLETSRCGCHGYMAPEVINKEGYGLKADVFSCGAIIYALYLKLSYII
jgi:serine/threonine protein kinase